jgi:cell division transport system permease protein
MATSFERYQKRRLISSYFSVVISIFLVLLLVGALGLFVVNTKKVADHFKEQIAMSVYFKESAKKIEINQLEKSLALSDYSKSTNFVSKEIAAKSYSEQIGEDFMNFIGENPLQSSLDVYFEADYVSEDKIAEIANNLSKKNFVDDVVYDQPLIALLDKNIQKISFWILISSIILTFIAVLLINSSIRLSVYSKRFTIKTMQMVGATKGFIRRPFIWKSIRLGIIGSLLAVAGLAVLMYYLNKNFPDLNLLADKVLLGAVFGGVVLLGIIITWISTFFATQRFLNLKTDELYY